MEEENKKINEGKYGKELNIFNQILCQVAGSDLEILSQCPHEISRHARIGAIIISTAILASVSMFFAIQTVSQSTFIGIIAGAVWGLVIFILDSYIVASYRKNDDRLKEISIVLPRLILAFVLGCSISIPLELKVFENEIMVAVDSIETEQETAKQEQANNKYNNEIAPYINERNTLQASNDKYKNELKPFEDKVTRLEGELADEIAGKGRTGKLKYGPVSAEIDEQLIKAREDKHNKENEINSQFASNNTRITELNGLIAKIQPEPVKKVDLYGISAQLDGLKRLTSSNAYVLIAYLIFFLLVLLIETAPVLVKFFTPKGSYDVIQETTDYIVFLGEQKKKSDLHELINSEIQAIRSLHERKNTAQDHANQMIMEAIAEAQAAIATKAINLWKEKQLSEVGENVEDFVRTNESQTERQTSDPRLARNVIYPD